MIIVLGHPELDTGWIRIDTDTGEVTRGGGNVAPGVESRKRSTFDDFKAGLSAVKHIASMSDTPVRKRMLREAGDHLTSTSEILDTRGNVIAIF